MEKQLLRNFPSRKSPEPDNMEGFWLKKKILQGRRASQRENMQSRRGAVAWVDGNRRDWTEQIIWIKETQRRTITR